PEALYGLRSGLFPARQSAREGRPNEYGAFAGGAACLPGSSHRRICLSTACEVLHPGEHAEGITAQAYEGQAAGEHSRQGETGGGYPSARLAERPSQAAAPGYPDEEDGGRVRAGALAISRVRA